MCNIFKPKLQYDQICYETDLELLKNKEDTNIREVQREIGLILVLDYNEDRQINMDQFNSDSLQQNVEKAINQKNKNSVSTHLDTLGRFVDLCKHIL